MAQKKLTLEEKTNYMRIGLGLASVTVNNMTAELIVKIYDGVLEMGGQFSLNDAAKIEVEVTEKYKKEADKTPKSE